MKRFAAVLALAVSLLTVPDAAARALRAGDRGKAVKVVQRALGIPADGIYGRATARAVRRFQRAHGLRVTGRVNAETREALLAPTSTGGTESPEHELDIVAAARSALGRPYRAGAVGPDAFDAGGFVMWAAAQAGIELPRSSYAQYRTGRAVGRAEITAGDLVFFEIDGEGASGVGIAVSATHAITATTHGVREHEILGPYWGEHFLGARRI